MISSHVRRAVRVRARDGVGVEVERARHEAADQRAAGRERAVPGRRQVHQAGAGWKFRIGNANGYTAPSQPTTSSGESSSVKPCQRPRAAPPASRRPSSSGPTNVGRPEVAVAVRRVHAQLADLVAPLPRDVQAAGQLEA
jgi:hypothetical protein